MSIDQKQQWQPPVLSCYYCDKIRTAEPSYEGLPAAYDLGSSAPRCSRHWRVICSKCSQPNHFEMIGWCAATKALFCAACARSRRKLHEPFWHRLYETQLQSPFVGAVDAKGKDKDGKADAKAAGDAVVWCLTLDRLEHQAFTSKGAASDAALIAEAVKRALSPEQFLVRYQRGARFWGDRGARDAMERPLAGREGEFGDEAARSSWNSNAVAWAATYDEDGDETRKYQTDEPLLAMLGDVRGKRVLDVGSGNGYLCRKLATQGGAARVVGVDICDGFVDMALKREEKDQLGITYVRGSVCEMRKLLAGKLTDGAIASSASAASAAAAAPASAGSTAADVKEVKEAKEAKVAAGTAESAADKQQAPLQSTSKPAEQPYFDAAVSNFVLMDVPDFEAALRETSALLRPGSVFAVVLSHPAFECGPGNWHQPAIDSLRPEDRYAMFVDEYFHVGPHFSQWGELKPVLGFHRPLYQYFRAFTAAGFAVTDFFEPSITERGRRELAPWVVRKCQRIPWSCIFRLVKTGQPAAVAAGLAPGAAGADGAGATKASAT